MLNKRAMSLLAWVALFLFCSTGMAEGVTVKALEIQGNKKIDTDAIRGRIQTQVGQPLLMDLIRSDIQAIHGLGYFDQIEAIEEDVAGGVKIIFQVKEKATISSLEYVGLDAMDEDEAKEQTEVKQYEVLDIHKLNRSVEKLADKYEEKGYYLADVRYEITMDEAKNEAKVTFRIDENDKVQVRSINIIGNERLTDEELKGVMQTQEGGFFSWLTGSGAYRESLFERDIAALGYYYGTLGYVRARFGKPEVTVSPDRKWIYITFFVEEGEQYDVGEVDFKGALLFTRDELFEGLGLIKGETFNAETLRRETLRYTEKYADLGYAFANVIPQPVIHDDTRTVDINFEVDRGQRVYIGKITVTGNTRTKDKVIRRELTIREGELYNGTKKRESRERVVRLGFFDSAEFHQSSGKNAPDIVDIEIRVKERSTGQLVIGAGYASGNIGFTAHAQLSQNNFLGNGQVASLSAQILTGQNLYEFNVGFTEPYVGASLWSLGGDLFQLRRTVSSPTPTGNTFVQTYQEIKTGFDVKLGHPILEYTNLFVTYKAENSYVQPESIIDPVVIPRAQVNGVTSSVTASVVFDKRDDRFDPRDGWYWSLSSEFAGVGGTRKYWRNRGELKFFHNPFWDLVFRSQVKVGAINSVAGNLIPVNELFIMGGLYSLRGYKNLSIGPKATLTNNLSQQAISAGLKAGDQIVIGGQYEVQANLELEFPILKEARIRGVVFFDAGNSFNGLFAGESPALLANYGFGFRWFTPIGPLRFEFGYPIVARGSSGSQFYFTIGPPF